LSFAIVTLLFGSFVARVRAGQSQLEAVVRPSLIERGILRSAALGMRAVHQCFANAIERFECQHSPQVAQQSVASV
jgi:hypothetical protein